MNGWSDVLIQPTIIKLILLSSTQILVNCVDQLKLGIGLYHQEYLPTWTVWKNLFLKKFEVKKDSHKVMYEMANFTSRSSQSLYSYTFEKLAFINKMNLEISDMDKVNLIFGGIKNERICFSVDAVGLTDTATLSRHLITDEFKQLFFKRIQG